MGLRTCPHLPKRVCSCWLGFYVFRKVCTWASESSLWPLPSPWHRPCDAEERPWFGKGAYNSLHGCNAQQLTGQQEKRQVIGSSLDLSAPYWPLGTLDQSLLDGHMHMHVHTHTCTHAHTPTRKPRRHRVQRALGLGLISRSACDLPYSSCLACPGYLQTLTVRLITKAQCSKSPVGVAVSWSRKAKGPEAAQGWCRHHPLHSAPRRLESGSATLYPPCHQTRTAQALHFLGGRCKMQGSCPG